MVLTFVFGGYAAIQTVPGRPLGAEPIFWSIITLALIGLVSIVAVDWVEGRSLASGTIASIFKTIMELLFSYSVTPTPDLQPSTPSTPQPRPTTSSAIKPSPVMPNFPEQKPQPTWLESVRIGKGLNKEPEPTQINNPFTRNIPKPKSIMSTVRSQPATSRRDEKLFSEPSLFTNTFGSKLYDEMMQRQLSPRKVALLTGVDEGRVLSLVKGEDIPSGQETVKLYEDVFGIPPGKVALLASVDEERILDFKSGKEIPSSQETIRLIDVVQISPEQWNIFEGPSRYSNRTR